MKRSLTSICICCAFAAFLAQSAARAQSPPRVTIELLPQAQCPQNIVRLADVARVTVANGSAESWNAIELFPTPPQGSERAVAAREVQDLLALRGAPLWQCDFTGAASVTVTAGAGPVRQVNFQERANVLPARALSAGGAKRVEQAVTEAIVRLLREQVDARVDWRVSLDLAPATAVELASLGGPLRARGGGEPWTGQQQFAIISLTDEGVSIPIVAHVARPELVVVAARPIRRGEKLRRQDVQLGAMPNDAGAARGETYFHSVDDIVGQETTRSYATGQAVEGAGLRPPVLVRRNEAVTVYARGPGLVVRTTGRAMEDGGKDDLVTVQSLLNTKERFSARVVDIQEVEILALGTTAANPPASRETADKNN